MKKASEDERKRNLTVWTTRGRLEEIMKPINWCPWDSACEKDEEYSKACEDACKEMIDDGMSTSYTYGGEYRAVGKEGGVVYVWNGKGERKRLSECAPLEAKKACYEAYEHHPMRAYGKMIEMGGAASKMEKQVVAECEKVLFELILKLGGEERTIYLKEFCISIGRRDSERESRQYFLTRAWTDSCDCKTWVSATCYGDGEGNGSCRDLGIDECRKTTTETYTFPLGKCQMDAAIRITTGIYRSLRNKYKREEEQTNQ